MEVSFRDARISIRTLLEGIIEDNGTDDEAWIADVSDNLLDLDLMIGLSEPQRPKIGTLYQSEAEAGAFERRTRLLVDLGYGLKPTGQIVRDPRWMEVVQAIR